MSDRQVIYDPAQVPYFETIEHHCEIKSWLRANDISPDSLDTSQPITVETGPDGERLIRYTAHPEADGPHGERTTPLAVEPPTHWYLSKENTDGR